MRKTLCTLLAVMILLAGCAGRMARPVQIQQRHDESRSAEALRAELSQIDEDIQDKQKTRGETLTWNIICGVTGAFVLFPWFFMNFKDAEGTEIEALKQRRTWLTSILEDREAGIPPQPVPAVLTPSEDRGQPLYRPGWNKK